MIAAGGLWAILVLLFGGLGALGSLLGLVGVGGARLKDASPHLSRAGLLLGFAGTAVGVFSAAQALAGKAPDAAALMNVLGTAASPLALGAGLAGLGALLQAVGAFRSSD